MKKIFILFIFQLFFASANYAQTKEIDTIRLVQNYVYNQIKNSFTVKGIELLPGLQIMDFLNIALSKGLKKEEYYNLIYEQTGMYELVGTFYGYDNCKIWVIPIGDNKQYLGSVGISFPQMDSFDILKSLYDNLKYSLSKKYYLYESTEIFYDDYVNSSNSNQLKLSALADKNGKFESRFYVSEKEGSAILGDLTLCIRPYKTDQQYFEISLLYHAPDYFIYKYIKSDDDL